MMAPQENTPEQSGKESKKASRQAPSQFGTPKVSGSADVRPPKAIEVYWVTYGGWWALVRSPYFWIAIALTIICWPIWSAEESGVRTWNQIGIDIIPSMLGFSLGGMAILLAFSSPILLQAIREGGDPGSLFMATVAAFFHFILLQTAALLLALLSKAYSYDLIAGFGFFMMIYAILTAIAVASFLINISRIFNATSPLDGNKNCNVED